MNIQTVTQSTKPTDQEILSEIQRTVEAINQIDVLLYGVTDIVQRIPLIKTKKEFEVQQAALRYSIGLSPRNVLVQ
jgi:hypothetical protein